MTARLAVAGLRLTLLSTPGSTVTDARPVTDPAVVSLIPQTALVRYACGIAGALAVLAIGKVVMARRAASAPAGEAGSAG